MKRVYLVRHGQTDSNVGDLLQDGSSQLSDTGRAQAIVLANRLQHLSFSHLLVSDYDRTKQTVEPLLEKIQIEPEYTPLLRETKRPSEFVGLPRKSEEFQNYLRLADENIHNSDWHFSDEENFHDVIVRIRELFATMSDLEGDVLAITHGRLIIFMVMYTILGENLSPDAWLSSMHSFDTANTGITVLKFNDEKERWLLDTFNDQAHFAE